VSVEFEPVRLGRRRRRLDPVAIGAVTVAIALGAAVLKPWDATGSTSGSLGEASSAPVASGGLTGPHATATAAMPGGNEASAASALTWAQVESVLHRHEAWGVRAIVIEPSAGGGPSANRRFAERWLAVSPGDGDAVRAAQLDPSDRSVIALGVTFPPEQTPLDVRIWRLGAGGLEWVDTEALDSVPSGGAFLYFRPGGDAGQPRSLSAGTYRIDVLVGGSIRRVEVTIPDRFANVPGAAERPSLRDNGPLGDPAEAALPDLPIGLFATVAGTALPLPADEGPPLDEAAAWLNVDPGTRREPRSFVAAAFLSRATGLGVMLPPGSVVQSAALERLAPGPLPGVPARVEVPGQSTALTAHVLFGAPDGRAWTPGVYRISVVWADADGLHDKSWHAELRPSPVREQPRLLAAARAWARYAGATGVILGTAEPLEGGPASSVIRLLRLRPDVDPAYPAETGIGCGATAIEGSPGILGFAYPADHYASTARATLLFPFPRGEDRVVMSAAFGVPGLILVAPARNPVLATAAYRFTIGDPGSARTYSLCLGQAQSND